MFRKQLTLLTFVFSLLFSLPALSQELAERKRISREVAIMYYKSDFAGLEKLADQFRSSDARTSSGQQRLNIFYYGLRDAVRFSIRKAVSFEELEDRADSWIEAYPNSPTSAIAKAITLTQFAWHIRGSGYASTVKPEAWAPFYKWLIEADDQLLKTKYYASRDPFWYTQRAVVLNYRGVETDTFLKFMEEGLGRHPNFYQLYFAAVDYFVPKWHGDAIQLEQFAQKAVALTRATEGEALYARIYWYAAQTQYSVNLFSESNVVWSNMKQGINDVLSQYPDQWNIQNFALFACIANDAEMTSKLFALMQGNPIAKAWKKAEYFDYCMKLAGTNQL